MNGGQPTPEVPETTRFYARIGKPLFDRLVGLGLALVTLPILLVLVAVMTIVLRSSPVVREPRVGHRGRPFKLYRLRIESSRKVSRIGRVLQRLSLDELPQLWNVVFGSMSLVGPPPLQA